MRILLLSVCLISSVAAESVALDSLLETPELKPASVGVFVIPLDGGETALEWRADKALIPASTMKAVMTATAMQVLGPKFCFETHLYQKGNDLVVKGGGDPTLGATGAEGAFSNWLTEMKSHGVNEFEDLWIDPTRFEEQRAPNEWPSGDVGNYYGAGPSGANYHLNSFSLTFKTGSVGERARLSRVFPKPPGVEILNYMRTGSANSGDQGYVYGIPGSKVLTLRGTVPARGTFTIKGALPEPPLMLGTALKSYLVGKGIEVNGQVKVGPIDVGGIAPFHVSKSPSLAKIIKGTNHRSVNLYADSIFKILTPVGSTKASIDKVKTHWQKQGVDLTGFVMHDGSGLSPRGVITPRQLGMILKMAREHETGPAFLASLPLAGKSGTLVGFGKGTTIENNVRAKSGGLTGVWAYAGYFTGQSGREYAFAVMVNNAIGSPTGKLASFLADLVDES